MKKEKQKQQLKIQVDWRKLHVRCIHWQENIGVVRKTSRLSSVGDSKCLAPVLRFQQKSLQRRPSGVSGHVNANSSMNVWRKPPVDRL
ncbi:hypothetical protein E2C01_072172 [Portunus trituberculatus]|uniref:Uncharacterized protein n=1 Tax=Portunus trituberculatus TaxID=210409 RepID=A0A5B7HZ78_PORTR|nr:hypothetical protein [Portunus trituberculatus]